MSIVYCKRKSQEDSKSILDKFTPSGRIFQEWIKVSHNYNLLLKIIVKWSPISNKDLKRNRQRKTKLYSLLDRQSYAESKSFLIKFTPSGRILPQGFKVSHNWNNSF